MYFDENKEFTVTANKSNNEFALAPLLVTITQKLNNETMIINSLVQNETYQINYTTVEQKDDVMVPVLENQGGFSFTKDTESDWIFQLCTKHPFTIESLTAILNIINTEVDNFNKEQN